VLVEWRFAEPTQQAWIDPAAIGRGDLVHGYAMTIAGAQGLSAQRAYIYGYGADVHSLYPGTTRAKVQSTRGNCARRAVGRGGPLALRWSQCLVSGRGNPSGQPQAGRMKCHRSGEQGSALRAAVIAALGRIAARCWNLALVAG
jgi:hypothetical protein